MGCCIDDVLFFPEYTILVKLNLELPTSSGSSVLVGRLVCTFCARPWPGKADTYMHLLPCDKQHTADFQQCGLSAACLKLSRGNRQIDTAGCRRAGGPEYCSVLSAPCPIAMSHSCLAACSITWKWEYRPLPAPFPPVQGPAGCLEYPGRRVAY